MRADADVIVVGAGHDALHDACSSGHVIIQSSPLLCEDELELGRHGLRYVETDPAVVSPSTTGPR